MDLYHTSTGAGDKMVNGASTVYGSVVHNYWLNC